MKKLVTVALLTSACAAQRPSTPQVLAQLQSFLCRYQKNPYSLPDGRLALSSDATGFAHLSKSRPAGVTLTIPTGAPDEPLQVKFTSGWVTVYANYRPDKGLLVYPLKTLPFGVLTMGGWTQLEYRGSPDGKHMDFVVRAPTSFRPNSPLRVTLTCEETTITPRTLDKAPVSVTDGGPSPMVGLTTGADIPVASVAGGPAEGILHFATGARAQGLVWADELERRSESVLLRADLGPGTVTGWVPESATRPPPDAGLSNVFGALGGGYGFGGLGMRPGSEAGEGKPSWPRCLSRVPLFLARGTTLEQVGELHPKAAVVEKRSTASWIEVELPELKWVELDEGTNWALAPGGMATCLSHEENP